MIESGTSERRATVLVVEDDAPLREALCATLERGGYRAVAAADGEVALRTVGQQPVDLVISDVQMPRLDGARLLASLRAQRPELPVLLMTAFGSIESAVQAMREGAADYLVKPFESEVLVSRVESLLPEVPGDAELIAADRASRELLAVARRVAASDATVLLSGESGVGKEMLFRYIHRHSRRADGPAVAVNCAAIPENMLEAMLFGYEKGAFTGAYRASAGKFEQANGGTLLLDEVTEMGLPLQAKLLRVLQERQVERLGGQHTIELDVRVVATTNRDLREEVAAGRFREDLYYRINVFPLHIAPLRERPADIRPLARALLERAAARSGEPVPAIDEAALEALEAYPWPGNVRELDNVMQRALILGGGRTITVGDLRFEAPAGGVRPQPSADSGQPAFGRDLQRREFEIIAEALAACGGSRKGAAQRLGLSPRTLRYRMARLREQGFSFDGD